MRNFFDKKRSITTIFFAAILITTSLVIISCSSKKDLMTEPLFRQAQRVNVELPDEGWLIDSITGAVIAAETVTYTHEDRGEYYNMDSVITTPVTGESSKVDITKGVHKLRSVEVKAKSRFAPEREGYINTDFMVRIPKELLSSNWQVVIDPVLMHNDSLVPLKRVIVRGSKFADKQKESYANYRKFLESLVGKPEYDKYFLDKKNIERDIKKQQNHYFNQYYYAWNKRVNFDKWKFEREDQDAFYYAKRMGFNFKKYSEYSLKTLLESDPNDKGAKITIGLSDKYREEYEKATKGFPSIWKQDKMTEKVVPRRFRQTFRDSIAARDITNKYLTDADIENISENRYFFDDIALNEAMIHRRRDIFKTMVRYPYNNPETVFLDTITEGKEDFELYYRHEYKVVEGLKNVRVTLNSQIQAIDRSTYKTAKPDTITYIVSSLSQLMDTTLAVRENVIYRNMRDFITMYFEYPPNEFKFDINYTLNRAEMSKFFEIYDRIKQNGFIIDNIDLVSSASLDGLAETNERLSGKRLEEVLRYILEKNPELSSVITTKNIGEDVSTALTLIEKSDIIHNKEKILQKLKTMDDTDLAELEIRYAYRDDYRNMREYIYPKLRKIEATFTMHRDSMVQEQAVVQQILDGYQEGLRLLEEREYTKALTILEHFSDYNTALTLTCLGYNSKAYELLRKLDQNSNTEYLLAIVMYRMKNEKNAVDHLIKACELDHTKVFRTNLDSETKALVLKYNLQSKLDSITDQYVKKQYEDKIESEEEAQGVELEESETEQSTDTEIETEETIAE